MGGVVVSLEFIVFFFVVVVFLLVFGVFEQVGNSILSVCVCVCLSVARPLSIFFLGVKERDTKSNLKQIHTSS